jgi:RNA polymerase sigma factor (sigma-70 family)
MVTAPLGTVLGHIRNQVAAHGEGEESDGALLRAFLSGNDQAAFEVLLRRHGPMVLRVCRRSLGHVHDAEDACQATFLVLARQARSIRKRESLAGWLHGVAYRMARQSKRAAARRHKHEARTTSSQPPDPGLCAAWREVQELLDEEIAGLPESLRTAFVCCCLENKSCAEVGRLLGVKESAVAVRLSRARKRLQQRLSRRGLALTTVLAAAAVGAGESLAALPRCLVGPTLRAAAGTAAGQPLAGVPAHVITLAEGVSQAMLLGKCKATAALLAGAALLGAALGLAVLRCAAAEPPARSGQAAAKEPGKESTPRAPVAPEAKAREAKKTIKVRGQVLGPDGKPVRAAWVCALHAPALARPSPEDYSAALTDETRTDAEGRFELGARAGGSSPPAPIHPLPVILVRADGYGYGVHPVTDKTSQGPIVVRLPREQVLRARFVDDTNNKPVKELVVKVASVRHGAAMVVAPAQASRAWFPAAKTDAQGRIQLRGISTGEYVFVEWRSPRFLAQRLDLWRTEAHWEGKEVVYKLMPPAPGVIAGRVTFKDTGKPAAGVSMRTRGSKATTDADGRFRLTPDWEVSTHLTFGAASDYATTVGAWVEVDAPPDSAYLGWRGQAGPGRRPKGDGTLGPWEMGELRIALPRGARLQGHVLEAGTNKGVPGATISFGGRDVQSGPDGAFSLTTAAGSGLLIVKAGADYAPVKTKVREGLLAFGHAIVPVELKDGADARPIKVVLRRGAVVKGKLTGPDGRPAQGAMLISRLMINRMGAWVQPWAPVPHVAVPADFELRGCDPENPYPVLFFEEKKAWGALVQVPGKQPGKPLEVRLQPCGAARARFLTADGRPITERRTVGDLFMVLAPGDTANWSQFIEHSNVRKDWTTDAQGRITWRDLVPGVTYRVWKREFKVKSGEVLDLGDLK